IEAADFPILSTNLDMTESILAGLTHDYLIIERDGIKIGVLGVSPQLEGLVAGYNYEGILWLDPIEAVNNTAAFLKNEQSCDLVVCLSHLGFYKDEEDLGDITLAKQTRNVDLILGGHTHTYLEEAVLIPNPDGKEVLINQVGDRGTYFGRVDIRLQEEK
ncbi:bifunctional metallophosphatase/5'-nucleotidase, partial [Bacteroidales bacterium OttesenSCG-928-L03]|nr:bifunctional metallophosphatase/5'-nucleotidase [Bacteroidales bacterium OttesenSCG-928-L03]